MPHDKSLAHFSVKPADLGSVSHASSLEEDVKRSETGHAGSLMQNVRSIDECLHGDAGR